MKSRKHQTAFAAASPTGLSPPPKQRLLMSPSSPPGFLSPGTLESPNQVQSIVGALKRHNQSLQGKVEAVTTAEEGLRQELQEKEDQHRNMTLKLESQALQRERELQAQLEIQSEEHSREIVQWREKAHQGEEAQEQLRLALDELELLEHNKHMLSETTEKMNKFREKVNELAHVKDALAKEQSNHAQAIDDLVNLQAQVQTLESTQRQLEDYKMRAIEAEVKLVECQDYLRRVEQQTSQESDEQARLYEGTVMQQQEMQDMIDRIQKETSNEGIVGIGEGVSELNMEIQQELAKLRNENLQLRAFAAKRQQDAVQSLEKELEETRLISTKYQTDFRSTQQRLANTQKQLHETEEQQDQLASELEEWKQENHACQARIRVLEESLETTRAELESAQADLTQQLARNENLTQQLQTTTTRALDAEKLAAQRQEHIVQLSGDLEASQEVLVKAEQQVQDLTEQVEAAQERADCLQEQLAGTEEDLNLSEQLTKRLQENLHESQLSVEGLENKIEEMTNEKQDLQRSLSKEQDATVKAQTDADQALEATRQVLEAKADKDMESLRENMNQILEEERESTRQKLEEAKQMLKTLNDEWEEKCKEMEQESVNALEQSNRQAEEQVASLVEKHQASLEAARLETEEAKESCDNIVRKGRTMLEEAKAKATKDFQELKDEIDDLREQLDQAESDKREMEQSLRNQLTALEQKLSVAENQNEAYSEEVDALEDKVQSLGRERLKLEEDNERYRRQMGGRFGSDGNALERLQNEYNIVLQENRNLKREARYDTTTMSSISESECSYSRNNTMTTLSQLRQEYQETIESLKDEKRELVMQNSAAASDVRKAELRAWEQEQEVARLKGELTSTQLQMQRIENGGELSFFSAQSPSAAVNRSGDLNRSTNSPTALSRSTNVLNRSANSPSAHSTTSNLSPALERAMRHRAEREEALRDKFTSLTGSPCKSPPSSMPLSPTRRHEQLSNQQLLTQEDHLKPEKSDDSNSMADLLRLEEIQMNVDGKPECTQS